MKRDICVLFATQTLWKLNLYKIAKRKGYRSATLQSLHKFSPLMHNSYKSDPDPHQRDADPQHCMTVPMYGQPTLFSVSSTNFWQSLEGLPMSGKMAAMAWNTVSAGMKAMSFLRCSTILSFSSFSSSSCRCWQSCQFHHEMWEIIISENVLTG